MREYWSNKFLLYYNTLHIPDVSVCSTLFTIPSLLFPTCTCLHSLCTLANHISTCGLCFGRFTLFRKRSIDAYRQRRGLIGYAPDNDFLPSQMFYSSSCCYPISEMYGGGDEGREVLMFVLRGGRGFKSIISAKHCIWLSRHDRHYGPIACELVSMKI